MLDANSLWMDEARPFLLCNTDNLESFFALLPQLNPHYAPLDLLVRFFTMKIFGDSVFIFLLPSVIFSTLGILIYFFIVKQMLGKQIAFIHAMLLTIHPLDIQYAQSGNNYAILNIFVPLSFLFLFKGIKEGKFHNWIWYSFFLSLCFYSHLITLSVAISQLVLIIMTCVYMSMTQKKWKNILKVVFSYGLAGLLSLILFSPWLYGLYLEGIYPGQGSGGTNYSPIIKIISKFLAAEKSGLPFLQLPMATFTIVGCIFLFRENRNFILRLASVCIVSYAVAYFATINNFFTIRYIFYLLPLYLIVPAAGILNLMDRLGRYVNEVTSQRFGRNTTVVLVCLTLTGLMVLNIPSVRSGYARHWHGAGQWKDVAQVINERHEKDEFLIIPHWSRPAFSVYSDVPVYGIQVFDDNEQPDLVSVKAKLNRLTKKDWTDVNLRQESKEEIQSFIDYLKRNNKTKGRIALPTNSNWVNVENMRTWVKYFKENSREFKLEHFNKFDLITVTLGSADPQD